MTDPFAVLRSSVDLGSPELILAFESALGRLPPTLTQGDVAQLLKLFRDETEAPEVMFSVVHKIEKAPVEVELGALLPHLQELEVQSPWWAEVLIIRILNHEPSRLALEAALPAQTPGDLAALRALLDKIGERDSQVSALARTLRSHRALA